MRLVQRLTVCLAIVLCLCLGGCVISTPDTADSGTGVRAEAKWPFGCCPDKGE